MRVTGKVVDIFLVLANTTSKSLSNDNAMKDTKSIHGFKSCHARSQIKFSADITRRLDEQIMGKFLEEGRS